MSNFNLEVVEFQIASEVTCTKDGKGFFSIRAVARLSGLDHSTLSKSLQTGGGENKSKLAEHLLNKGFKVVGVLSVGTEGVPDTMCAAILEFYAFEAERYRTVEALLAFRAFAAIGIRIYAQKIAGWQSSPIVDYKQALLEVLEEQIPTLPSVWECRFIPAFWEQIERLYGLKRNQRSVSSIINAYVYNYFPVEVKGRLDEINPISESGFRKNKQHLHFDKQLLELLKVHIAKVIVIMEASPTKNDFIRSMKFVKKVRLNKSNVRYLKDKQQSQIN